MKCGRHSAGRGGTPKGADDEDKRTKGARAVDQLDVIVSQILATESTSSRQGGGSAIVSKTVDDAHTMTAESQFLSHTGHLLSPLDLLNLGAAEFDSGVLHDRLGTPRVGAFNSLREPFINGLHYSHSRGCAHVGTAPRR